MWRVSKMTVYRMVHSGQLHTLRVGHRFRIPRTAVETCQQLTRATEPGRHIDTATARSGSAPIRCSKIPVT